MRGRASYSALMTFSQISQLPPAARGTADEWWGQFFYAHTLSADPPIHSSVGPALICFSGKIPTHPGVARGEGQGQLTSSPDPEVSSPDCLRWSGVRGWRASPLTLPMVPYDKGVVGPVLPCSQPPGCLICTPTPESALLYCLGELKSLLFQVL